jgi:acyl-CoA reductase-like NAD-dependent aldehyde dehydrogenase
MSITGTRTVASIIAGETREGGRPIESRNPANLEEVVCEALLGDADHFVDACRAARAAQPAWAAGPSPRSAGSSRTTRRRWPGS